MVAIFSRGRWVNVYFVTIIHHILHIYTARKKNSVSTLLFDIAILPFESH